MERVLSNFVEHMQGMYFEFLTFNRAAGKMSEAEEATLKRMVVVNIPRLEKRICNVQ